MDIVVRPGKYVVAVSGGVDSMVLLDLLAGQKGFELIVAHFEHGIRADSEEDYKLVKATAARYKLPFVASHGHLGVGASEATARTARYDFLRHVMAEEKADGIITAHHQDDMLETAVLNLLRGTGRLGLSSLKSTHELIRPLLGYSKDEIKRYAAAHNITWREDSTNADDKYLRNYIRRNILPKLGEGGRAKLLERINRARHVNDQIDALLTRDLSLHSAEGKLDRKWFIQLPYAVSTEVMAAWLRSRGITLFDRTLIDYLVVQAKTKQPGKMADVNAQYKLEFSKGGIKLDRR